MQPEKAEEMLLKYKEHKGRCGFLRRAIAEVETDIQQWRANLASDLVNSGGVNMDGMPHGTTVSNPTERMGLMLAAGYVPEGLTEAERRLKRMKDELREKETALAFVESWLQGLTERESWLIEEIYFEKRIYAEVITEYRKKYGIPTNKDGIRRAKKKALEKIFAMAE